MIRIGRKTAFLWAAVLIVLVLCGGCGGAGDGDTATDDPAGTPGAVRYVVDANDREVTIPDRVDRIAITCQGGTTHEVAIFGAGDKIVAQPEMNNFPQLLRMFPQFKDVLDPGSFDNVNIEEIIKADPDIVLVGISSKKGNQLIEDAGFPTYTMLIGWAAVETLKNEFLQVGTLLGNVEQAERLVDYWDEKMAYLAELLAAVPDDEKKSVLYGYSGSQGLVSVHGTEVWGDSLISAAGSVNAAAGISGSKEVSVEKVLTWDPDYVILQKDENALPGIKNDPRLSDLQAVKSDRVYQVPIGGFWWDRPSPESPLGFMWLASVVYPEYTRDIDLKKETKYFYKTFYGYDLSDDEYDSFF